MKLEDAIQQKKFPSEKEKLVVNLLFTSSWVNIIQTRFLKVYGLTPQQYNVLRILNGQKCNPISVNEVMSRMIDKTSNASRLVEKLKNKELLERKVCKKDRRSVDIIITPKGIDLLNKISNNLDEVTEHTIQISQTEAKNLNGMLDRLREKSKY